MSTPGQGSILGSPIIYAKVDYGPTFGQVYRPVNQRRIETVAGNDTVQPFDQMVIYKKTVPAAFSVILPDLNLWMAQPYGGFDLIFIDGNGDAATNPITFIPFGTQTIEGINANFIMNTNGGTLVFIPAVNRSGWTLIEALPSSGGGGTDYFATFENLTTGAAPVSINPAVFLTRIISGGTAGVEIVNFPNYTPEQSGKPHLIIFITRTNAADRIHITGSTPIVGSPYGGGVVLGNFGNSAPIYNPTLMALTNINQGFVLTWATSAWTIINLVQGPTITYEMASIEEWGPPPVPGILFQDTDGTLNMVMDPTNPQFHVEVTASADSGSPTKVPGGVRFVTVHSTGLGGPGYINFDGPAIVPNDDGATGIQKVVQVSLDQAGDTVICNDGSIRNPGNHFFTSFTFDFNAQIAVMHWDEGVWIADEPTNCTTVPEVLEPIMGLNTVAYVSNANTTVSIPAGYVISSICFSNSTANAVTGGMKIGTTSGGTDVVVAQAIGANAIGKVADSAVLKAGFSTSVNTPLFIQPVTSWNNARISLSFTLQYVYPFF